jgi:hypothetical protein
MVQKLHFLAILVKKRPLIQQFPWTKKITGPPGTPSHGIEGRHFDSSELLKSSGPKTAFFGHFGEKGH